MTPQTLDAERWPELVFGLVGPVGTDLPRVSRCLSTELARHGYDTEQIRLSSLIASVFGQPRIQDKYKRTKTLMDLGDQLRDNTKQNDAVALLAITKIRQLRGSRGSNAKPAAYILHSLKHPDEINILRRVYGPAFFLVSCYGSRGFRVDALAKKISTSRATTMRNQFRQLAEELIERDEKDPDGKDYGQNTRDAFPAGDVFIDAEAHSVNMSAVLDRFVRGVFGYQFLTPRIEEHCMFHAHTASVRSADLSRQVGAVISNSWGDQIASGCNEVPRAGGGQYWENDDPRHRDVELGYDSNQVHKEEIVSELLRKLTEAGYLKTDKVDRACLRDTRLLDILEFGRPVHAEMAALMDAARRGVGTLDATMYTTTYPCHVCARHIIAAGIKRVVYIEPYPKSLAKELYGDSVAMHGEFSDGAIKFEPFFGIAPNRYFDFFAMATGSRKDKKTGVTKEWIPQPIVRTYSKPYIGHEIRVQAYMIDRFKNKDISLPDWLDTADCCFESLPPSLKSLVACPSEKALEL